MVSAKQLIKNTTLLTTAFIGRKVLTLVFFVLIARYTSVETTGLYFLMVSFAAVFTSLMDFGLSTTLIREASKDIEALSRYLNNVLGLKILLFLIASFCGWTLINILDYPIVTRQLVLMIIIMMFLQTFADSFYACLRVHHQMKYEFRGILIGQSLTLAVGVPAIWFGLSIHYLILAILANQVFNFLYAFFQVVGKLGIRPGLNFDRTVLKPFVLISLPFLVSAVFGRLLSADTLILSKLTNEEIVGYFSVPSTLVGSLQFIPVALVAATFPALSAFHASSRERLCRAFTASYNSLLTFAVPVAVGIILFSAEIIEIAFGSTYTKAARCLQVLGASLIPMFVGQSVGSLLDACNRQVANMTLMGISAAVHLALTVILIPYYGGTGVALAVLAGYTITFLSTFSVALKILGIGLDRFLISSIRIGFAGLLMGLCLVSLKEHLHYLLTLPLATAVYLISLVVFRGMTRDGFDKHKAYGEWLSLLKRAFE